MQPCSRAGRSCIIRPRWAKWRSNICKRTKSNKRHVGGASFIAAPAAATVLSDFGADVIKIEPPGTGDPYRNLPNLPGYPQSEHNFAWMLESRNKKSLALDLSKPEGQAVLYRLVNEADVFITNFPPAVRGRLGMSWDHLKHLNDRLIYASFTGYGEKGAEANKPGFDSNAYL